MKNSNNQPNAFDKVIGYSSEKKELLQICDMLQNKGEYLQLEASIPKGIYICGEPGLGKTMLAKAFIEECGIKSYTLVRKKGENDFVARIKETFAKAKSTLPCIVLIEDIDRCIDDEEFDVVQDEIDDESNADVFIIATVKDFQKVPPSLAFSDRFDRTIELESPTGEEAEKIIKHFFSTKKIAPSVNLEDLSKMICYESFVELEKILDEAAVSAAYQRKKQIEMSDLVSAVLHQEFDSDDENYTYSISTGSEEKRIAVHEAGHLVCAEVLCPGIVGFATICPSVKSNEIGGFVHYCKDLSNTENLICAYLASKAAVEMYYADHVASGCAPDLKSALDLITSELADDSFAGFGFLERSSKQTPNISESLNARREAVISVLLEQYFLKAKDILIKNRQFLERVTDELLQKGTLLFSDIQRIKKSVTITPVAV